MGRGWVCGEGVGVWGGEGCVGRGWVCGEGVRFVGIVQRTATRSVNRRGV